MRYIEKDITGYATTYKTAYTYTSTYPWTKLASAVDWSYLLSPTTSATNAWVNTCANAKIYWSTSSSYIWYLDGIGTFKSHLDKQLNNKYGASGNGTTYTNFSCIPDGSELLKICFKVKSSLPKYNTESILYFKGTTQVSARVEDGTVYRLVYKSTAASATSSPTEKRISSGTVSNVVGQTFEKSSDGNFLFSGNTIYGIGQWTIADFKNGLFLPRVNSKSNSTSADTSSYYYLYSLSVTLTCKMPAYDINFLMSDPNGGTITGDSSGEYVDNILLKVTATPNEGYTFSHWAYDDGTINTNQSLSFRVKQDRTITAVFNRDGVNNVYGNTTKPSKVYVDKNTVKAIYVDTTKVYG